MTISSLCLVELKLLGAIFWHSINVWIILEPWKVLIWPKYLLIWYPDLNAISQTRYILQAHWKIWGLLGFLSTIFYKTVVFHKTVILDKKCIVLLLFCLKITAPNQFSDRSTGPESQNKQSLHKLEYLLTWVMYWVISTTRWGCWGRCFLFNLSIIWAFDNFFEITLEFRIQQ